MELKKMIAPFDATEPLEHLEQIFGIEERLLEAYSIDDLADAFDIRKTTVGDYLDEIMEE